MRAGRLAAVLSAATQEATVASVAVGAHGPPDQAELSHSALGHNQTACSFENQVASTSPSRLQANCSRSLTSTATHPDDPFRRHRPSLRGPGREDSSPPEDSACTARRRRLHSLESVRSFHSRFQLPLLFVSSALVDPTLRPFSLVLLTANEHTARPCPYSNPARGDSVSAPFLARVRILRLPPAHTCHHDG